MVHIDIFKYFCYNFCWISNKKGDGCNRRKKQKKHLPPPWKNIFRV